MKCKFSWRYSAEEVFILLRNEWVVMISFSFVEVPITKVLSGIQWADRESQYISSVKPGSVSSVFQGLWFGNDIGLLITWISSDGYMA